MSCNTCIINGVSIYPHYGVAPHNCFYKTPGAVIGESTLLPKNKWPFNFREDPDALGCGTYYCPDCKTDLPRRLKQKQSVFYISTLCIGIALHEVNNKHGNKPMAWGDSNLTNIKAYLSAMSSDAHPGYWNCSNVANFIRSLDTNKMVASANSALNMFILRMNEYKQPL